MQYLRGIGKESIIDKKLAKIVFEEREENDAYKNSSASGAFFLNEGNHWIVDG